MKSLSLSQRLLVGVLTPLLLIFGSLIITVAMQLGSALPQMHEEAAVNSVASRAAEISRWLGGFEKWLGGLSRDEYLNRSDLSAEERSRWLSLHAINDPALDSLFYIDPAGQAVTHKSPRLLNLRDRDYFHTHMAGNGPDIIISQPVLSKATQEPVTAISVPVRNSAGEVTGVLGVAVTMANLSVIANQLADKNDGREFGWVADKNGVLVAHPDKALRMKINLTKGDEAGMAGLTALNQRILSGNPGSGTYHSKDGSEYTAFFSPIQGSPGWTIGLSVPTASFTAESRSLLLQITGLMVVAVVVMIAALLFVARQMVRPVRRMVDMLHNIADGEGDLTQRLPVDGKDEISQLADGFNRFTDRIHKLMQQVAQTTQELNDSATSLQEGSNDMRDNVHKQQSEVDQIAAAMNEMESTVRDVAAHAQTASNAAQEGSSQAREGSMRVGRVREVIAEQAEMIRSSAEEVSALQESGAQIGQVMEVIRGIAEQTNLLALNAAIEAARAGDAGRGFAVVSDEVRQLAGRTHESTQQIQQTVEVLQSRISKAVEAMHASNERSQQSVGEAEAAHHALQAISEAIGNIEGMNLQIAAATEEQSATAAELNRNLSSIVEVSNTTLSHTASASESIEHLFGQADELSGAVSRFRL
ncbi:MAG: methyl-accepting chemotaxis protein [Pseudomonadota bacterium]|nr:methyl-accepting chemotaxis protein [Pseudomonadota bacterium]